MKRNNTGSRTIKEIMADYDDYDIDIFDNEYTLRIKRLEKIIFNDLDEIDKRIILLYAEYSSYKRVGEILGVSLTCAYNKVQKIRKIIMDNMKEKYQ